MTVRSASEYHRSRSGVRPSKCKGLKTRANNLLRFLSGFFLRCYFLLRLWSSIASRASVNLSAFCATIVLPHNNLLGISVIGTEVSQSANGWNLFSFYAPMSDTVRSIDVSTRME